MSNFSGENGYVVYAEPEGTPLYRGQIELSPEYEEKDLVGICLTATGNENTVSLGIKGIADVQQFLYAVAVQSKLIEDGEPLILMKKITAEDAA